MRFSISVVEGVRPKKLTGDRTMWPIDCQRAVRFRGNSSRGQDATVCIVFPRTFDCLDAPVQAPSLSALSMVSL